MNAPRVKPFDADSVDLSKFEGQFYSEELTTKYVFAVENGSLIVKHQRHSDFKLLPVKKDVFSSEAWFFGQAEFVRDETGSVTGCKVSSGRVRNVHFRKLVE